MPVANGTRFGIYEVTASLGAGGMGEVYRARDSRLNRDVALKVLPAALAQDAEYMARFEREAQVLASLNHPNIAAIYGIEENAIVMELVPGPTLEERIAAGKLPLDEALGIAKQISEALEAAHEKGIIHRDLKPANVKVTPEGLVKVLDFGLAKTAEPSAQGSDAMSPTLTIRSTRAGMIMGTAGYMSPEQAAGKPLDKRADIWAFGVVLYEMLTGARLFEGETLSHTLADVLRAPIDLARLPNETPPAIRSLLGRCLDRQVRNRLRDIGEARVAIQQVLANPSAGSAAQMATQPPAATRPPKVAWAVAAVAGIAALALGYGAWRHAQEEPPRVVSLGFPPPAKGAAFLSDRPSLAVSPDGRRLAFQAMVDGKNGLWVRDLDSPNARMLVATENGHSPFWSPDSRFIGFFDAGKLKKIDPAGGPAVVICDTGGSLGASWNQEDVIIFAPNGSGLVRVPAAGGTPTPVTEIDKSQSEDSHRYPWFLPDGRHFLYTVRLGERVKSLVYVGDLASKDRKPVVDAGTNALYARGYLLFVRNRTLMAQPFDAGKLRTTKGAAPVAEQISYNANAVYANFAASQDGVLAYTSSDLSSVQLTWFDRSGKALGTVGAPGELEMISLSPDQTTVVAVRSDPQAGNTDLWLHNLVRHTDSRLTFTGSNRFPVWSPDGTHIAFSGARDGSRRVYQKAGNGAGQEEILEAAEKLPSDWSRDGRYLITMTGSQNPKTGNDIWVLPLVGERKPFPYLQTEFAEFFARLSPDGRWLAYNSSESKRQEIYVAGFPAPVGKWQVSAGGGSRPVWSRDGKELYFLSAEGKIMAVEIKPGAAFQAGIPKPLFDVRMIGGNTNFEVSKDGHFLIPSLLEQSAVPITVVLNWTAMLKK